MDKRVDYAKKFLHLVRKKFTEGSTKYEEFLQIMKSFKDQKLDTETVCKSVQDLFKGQKTLLIEFNKLIPPNFRVNIETRPHYQEAIEYMKRVKEETKDNPLVYSEFIKVLKKYQDKAMPIDEVNQAVKNIMTGYPELIENFKAFLPNYNEGSSLSESDSEVHSKTLKSRHSPVVFEKTLKEVISEPVLKQEHFFKRLKKVMDLNSLPGSDFYLELCKSFELYIDCVITKTELFAMVEPLFTLNDFSNFLNNSRRVSKDDNREVTSFIQSQLKELFEVFKQITATRESTRRKTGWFFRPLSDFDSIKSKRHGHSYFEIQRPRILRDQPSHDINGQWVSVPHGSEDVSFRNFRKNMFEDALFKCEDERFEIELTIENALFTLRLLEKALDDANALSPEDQKNFQLNPKIFSKIRLKPIFQIYSEHAMKILEMLKENPIRSLSVIISRIKAKVETWKKSIVLESEKIWKETLEKNFYKSLDHRSFYFKQHEKKMMNPKFFISEAKSRCSAREESRELLRRFIRKEMSQQNFEFLGGSRNTLFFNSFAGLSAGVVHKISEDFKDQLVFEFEELDPKYSNCPDFCILPHFRLLFTSSHVLLDALRLCLVAAEKNGFNEKDKLDKWVFIVFHQVMGIDLPLDVLRRKVEDFFDGKFDRASEERLENRIRAESSKKSIEKWIKSESFNDVGENSISENVQEPILLVREDFPRFLPLLKENVVIYGNSQLFCFLRFFYDVYERLLKVKVILSNSGVDYEYKKVELGKYQFSLSVEQIYSEFLNAVLMLLKGNLEAGRFEDRCRTTLGNDSFIFFSFDKLVNSAARALQVLASDENSSKLLGLFSKYMKISQNEEMYSADCFHICNPAPVFRIHWNPDFKIMSVTFVESPFEKINELTVKNAQKYQKHFLNTRLQINTFDEIKNFIKRFHLYMGNDIAYPYLKDLVSFSHVKSFMIENSYRFYYLPGNEDFILNTSFYAHYTVLICDGESFLCKDKNSLFQKITENSEKKLNDFRNSWIGC